MNKLLLVIFFSVFLSPNLCAQEGTIELLSKTEEIEINKDSTFTRNIKIVFKQKQETIGYSIFYDSELEELTNIHLYIKKGKRLKEISKPYIFERNVELDYITSQKVSIVEIPKEQDIVLSYTIKSKELMYLSNLPFFTYIPTDSLKYRIFVPNEFSLSQNFVNDHLLKSLEIDSTITSNKATYKIDTSPIIVEPDPLQIFGIYRNMKVPLLRVLVTPQNYRNRPKNYLNDWYNKSITNTKGLYPSAKEKIDELTRKVEDPHEIIKILYDYVRNNFKYVAIEIGMGAFIPSNVNEVYTNKQGDCKDLSNFLSEALKYKGIRSELALAATFNHIMDCDFPSLSSANHVIVVAYVNNKKVLLDPTDPIHREGTPVESLQNRTILIINSDGGEFHKVKTLAPVESIISYFMNLKESNENGALNGSLKISYTGISDNYLKRILRDGGQKDFKVFCQKFYQEVLGDQSIDNLRISDNSENLSFQGNLTMTGKTFNDGSHSYIYLDFLPKLFETKQRETLIEGTHIYNPYQKTLNTLINLNNSIAPFDPIEYTFKEDGISLEMSIKQLSDKEIQCSYNFTFDDLIITKSNIDQTNKILEAFKNIINDPIILKQDKG